MSGLQNLRRWQPDCRSAAYPRPRLLSNNLTAGHVSNIVPTSRISIALFYLSSLPCFHRCRLRHETQPDTETEEMVVRRAISACRGAEKCGSKPTGTTSATSLQAFAGLRISTAFAARCTTRRFEKLLQLVFAVTRKKDRGLSALRCTASMSQM